MPDITKVVEVSSSLGAVGGSWWSPDAEVESVRRWIWSEVQRCWCWRLCRVWRVADETGSTVGLIGVEEIRVVRAEGDGGVVVVGVDVGFGDIELAILVVCLLFSSRRMNAAVAYYRAASNGFGRYRA